MNASPSSPAVAPALSAPAPHRHAQPSVRLAVLDALRGVAILLMALDHSAFFSHASVQAEHNSDYPTVLGTWGYVVTGLLTNIAAPTFWLLSGASIALLADSSRRRTGSEWAATRFLLIRAGLLLVLDLTLVPLLWEPRGAHGIGYAFDLLSSLAVGMLLMSALRFLPSLLLTAVMVALLAGFQWLSAHTPAGAALGWRMWTGYGYHTQPGVPFPILGWFPLMGLGFLLGRHLRHAAWLSARTWVGLGLGLLATFTVLRAAGGYGNIVPFDRARPWVEFVILSKGPPSLVFMLFNLGWMALLFAALLRWKTSLARRPWRWLVTLGKASLFAYLLHLALYRGLALVGLKFLPHDRAIRYALTFLAGVALLVPLTSNYRRLKDRYPASPLRYL